jgi:hypothetical protein
MSVKKTRKRRNEPKFTCMRIGDDRSTILRMLQEINLPNYPLCYYTLVTLRSTNNPSTLNHMAGPHMYQPSNPK